MWILTPSITSAFAAATGASTSASNEQLAAAFARSLLSRSKPSPQRTWLQRLKRDAWTTHLSGAISSNSLGDSFTDWWTSSLAATRANPSAPPASASALKTHDTSGLTYQPELLSCDQQSAFLRTSKDTFLSGCATSSKTWAEWVTERRGAWRARVNAARLTRGSGSLSWPTMGTTQAHISGQGSSTIEEVTKQRTFHLKERTNKRGEIVTRDGGKTHQATLASAVVGVQNWPTIRASEYKDVGPVGSKSHDHMLGKGYLCAVVTQEAATGQAAPVNWLTPQSGDVTGSTQEAVVMWANGQRPKTSDQRLRTQVAAEQLKHGQAAPASSSSLGSRQESWPTPSADGDSRPGANADPVKWQQIADAKKAQGINKQLFLTTKVAMEKMKTQKDWRTPTVAEEKNQNTSTQIYPQNQESWALRQAKGDVATMPLTAQVKCWATPRNCGGPDYAKTTRATSMSNSPSLPTQVTGKLNSQWVCGLMGLNLGWVSPSCPASVIKNWPRFVTGWLQATTAPTSCDCSGTALSRPLQSERGDFLFRSCGKEPTQ